MLPHCYLRPFTVLATVCAVLSAPLAILAADNPLGAIPDSAGVVARFKQPQSSIKKAVELAGKVDPRLAAAVEQMSQGVGVIISNPDQAGVDKSGDWWIAILPVVDDDPGVVFAVPAGDAEAMQKAVLESTKDADGGPYEFVTHENWVLYSNAAHAVEQLKKCAGGEVKPIQGAVNANSRAVLDGHEISVFVNIPRLRTVYKDQIDAAQVQFDTFMEQMESFSQPNQGFDMKTVVGMYRTVFQALLQALQDGESYTVGLAVEENALALEELCQFQADSPTAIWLKPHRPADLKVVDRLPAGQLVYYGLHGDSGQLMQWGMKLGAQMMQGDDASKEAFEKMMAAYQKLHFGAIAGAFTLGDLEGGCLRSTQVMEVAGALQVRDVFREITKAGSSLQFGPVKQTIDFKADAEQYGSRSVDVMSVKQEFDQESDPLGMQKQLSEAMFGPDGAITRVAYFDELVLQTLGGGKESMQAAIDAMEAKSSGSEEAASPRAQSRSQLAEKANLVFLVDLPRMVSESLGLVVKSGQFPIPLDAEILDQLILKPSYVGVSVTAEPNAMRAHVYVPAGQMQGIANIVTMFQVMRADPDL